MTTRDERDTGTGTVTRGTDTPTTTVPQDSGSAPVTSGPRIRGETPQTDTNGPVVDFGNLPFGPNVGQPYTGTSTGGVRIRGQQQGPTVPLNQQEGLSYEVIPSDPVLRQQVAFKTIGQIVTGEKLSPFATNEIMSSLRAQVSTPQIAYTLQNPQLIGEWQAAIWPNVLSTLVTDIPNASGAKLNDKYAGKVADFYKAHDTSLSTEERSFIAGLIAAMPDSMEQIKARGIDPSTYDMSSWWGRLQLGAKVVWNAPEAIRGSVNDPRDQLLSELHHYLEANPIRSPEDRMNFFLFATDRAQYSINESEQNKGGVFGFLEKTVALPFTTFGNEYNDWLNRAADPDHFGSKQHLSIGQSIAIGRGIDPGDEWYKTASGVVDGAVGVFFDPQNLAFGVGNGIRNAARVPRAVGMTKGEAFRAASRIWGGGRHLDLPVFDRGLVSRFAYAALSRDLDGIVDTQQAWRQWRWIAQTDSATKIAERFPDWQESTKMLEYMAETSDPNVVKELVRVGMQAPELLGADAPLLASKTAEQLASTVDKYKIARQRWLDDGGSLAGLSSLDEIMDGGWFRYASPSAAEITEQLAPAGRMGVSELYDLREVDVLSSMKTTPEGKLMPGRARVDEIKESIRRSGFQAGRGEPAQVFFSAETGEVFLGDANHRITALKELLDEGFDVPTELPVSVRQLVPGSMEAQMNATKFEDLAGESVTFFPRQFRTFESSGDILIRTGELTGDGTKKLGLSKIDGYVSQVDLSKLSVEAATYLDNANLTDDAATLAAGGNLSDLSTEGRRMAEQFIDAKGGTIGYLNGEAIATSKGRRSFVTGIDSAEVPTTVLDDLKDDLGALVRAKDQYADIHAKTQPHLWLVKDTGISIPTWTRSARMAMSTKGTGKFIQMLRRSGFRTTSTLPTNISLIETGAGAKQLRSWVKALGGTDDLANKWSDAFRAGNASTRQGIILDALREVGAEIKNPMLRDGLIEFGNKQGQYTYFFDRAGRELGLGADGRIKPMALVHFSDTFAMPDAKQLIRSIKRYNQTQRFPRLRRGFFDSTKGNRDIIKRNLQAKMRHLGVTGVDEDDLLSMAYADVLGGQYGRATGYGALSKAAGVVGQAYGMLHNTFVIAQLAGRPIAWASRVLLEETIRADLMGLPSLWRNPIDWARQVWDTAAIRHLPDDLAKQADVAEGLVNSFFVGGAPDLAGLRRVIPNLDAELAAASVSVADTPRLQAWVAHKVGRELSGMSELTIGARGNVTRSALKRQRSLQRTFEKMDEFGLNDAFRWDTDGQEIANRSFWQGFATETESATLPIEYSLTGMSTRGLQTYGRAYGRQMYQMIEDPIIGTFGFSRAIAKAEGAQVVHTAERLIEGRQWPKIKHIVDARLAAEPGFEAMTELGKASWYLDNVVDEIVETLYGPLGRGDLAEKARILRGLKNGGSVTVEMDGIRHTLNASRGNYEGFVKTAENLAQSAYNQNIPLPSKIAGYLDPRYGMEDARNPFRRVTDWTLMKFGEEPTQKLNRQPAYRHIRSRWDNYYRSLGWDEDTARFASAQKAAELTNYIFFDNKNIPSMLHDMNKVVPFFSAMWEVGSTWLYKIPSQNVLPVGYAQLGRRVQRTIRGLQATGLVSYDAEQNQMYLNVDREMLNANDPISKGIGRALFEYMRMPLTALEQLAGVYSLVTDGEFDSELDAWGKDGYSISIGNPIDFSSHGVMAVNQFSVGFTPALQLPASLVANAVFANSNEIMDTNGESVAEFLVANPEMDIGSLLRDNRDLFEEVNGADLLTRALNYDWDLDTLKMPDYVRIPETSLWETLVDRLYFPYGKIETVGQTIFSVVPSATQYVLRGLLIRAGLGDETEFMESFMKSTSAFGASSEILTQIQMLEASEGLVSRSLELSAKVQKLVDDAGIEVLRDPDGNEYVSGNTPQEQEAQELFRELASLNAQIIKRANDNAAGSLIMRGIMGHLGPSTPQMWTREQQQIAQYWSALDMKKEAERTGSVNYAKALAANPIRSAADMERFANLSAAFLNDTSGDQAKVWLKENNPALAVFTQGKSFWGEAGPPPEATGFDAWIDAVERGERKPFAPEVFMMRHLRSSLGTDKEIAIINEYGNDPDQAALDILADYDRYKELTDDFDMQFEALEFLDQRVFDGKYAAYRQNDVDDLSLYELVEEDVRRTTDEIETIQDLLDYGDLDPDERRRISGFLSSAQRRRQESIERQNNLANNPDFDNPREKVLQRYWLLSDQYYTEREQAFAKLETARNKDERSAVFEEVRQISDRWYNDTLSIEGFSGARLYVPSPEVRAWNGRSQADKQERIMSILARKPEWLSQFEVSILAQENPVFNSLMPATPQARQVYDMATMFKLQINAAAAADPTITESQREAQLRDVNTWLDEQLAAQGRFSELQYRDATPIQRLQMGGLLPDSLVPIMPMVNQIMAELAAEEKGPTSNLGFEKFGNLVRWLESDYFVSNPRAKVDLINLGRGMFSERLPSAVYSKMFQGSLFGDEIRVG